MTDTPRAILYRRVSTGEQAVSGLGLGEQENRLKLAAELGHWEIATEIADEGFSASTLHRPGLDRALQMLSTGDADLLAVTKLDRLSRSVRDFGDLLERAKAQGWALAVVDLGVDTSKPTGALVANVMIAVAQWERETITERTMQALAEKRRLGEPMGRRPATPQPLRERIYRDRTKGNLSFRAIARALNAEGEPTYGGGREWWPSTVRAVVRSMEAEAERSRRRASADDDRVGAPSRS